MTTYRPDIDGLRALAVMLVLLFHAEIPGFQGGYVGVDVFFVISGYLITRILLDDAEAGRLEFRTFYVRRVRRLLPALIATVALTLVAAALIMTPAHLAETALSGAFTALSLSNVYFAFGGSYFGAAAEIEPLLHTWSLSVEEQFYLIWPVTVFVLLRLGGRRLLLVAIALGLVGGLALSQLWLGISDRQAYFLPMFRAFQFLIGAGLVWVMPHRPGPSAETGLLALGLVMVIGSGVVYDAGTPFPGLAALVPSLGAGLALWCGRARWLGAGLCHPGVTWLGRISYSVYLAHWPVIVFWRYLTVGEFAAWEKAALLAASIAAGAALYYGVERRFRLGRGDALARRWRPLVATLGATGALAGGAFAIHQAGGLGWRMDLAPTHQRYAEQSAFHFLDAYEDGVLRLGTGQSGERILIFGDSMMQNYIPALMAMPRFAAADVTVVSRGGCTLAAGAVLVIGGSRDEVCLALRDTLYGIDGRFDRVVWSQRWLGGYGDRLRWQDDDGALIPAFTGGEADFDGWRDGVAATLSYFAARSDRMWVIGPQVSVDGVPEAMERIGPLAPLPALQAAIADISGVGDMARAPMEAGLHALTDTIEGVDYIDPAMLICPDGTCRFYDLPYSYFLDSIHHTRAATPLLSARGDALMR